MSSVGSSNTSPKRIRRCSLTCSTCWWIISLTCLGFLTFLISRTGAVLVGALQQDAAHAEDALAQGDLHADIAHAVKQDLLKLHVEQPLFAEDPIVGHGIFGEGDRQAEDAERSDHRVWMFSFAGMKLVPLRCCFFHCSSYVEKNKHGEGKFIKNLTVGGLAVVLAQLLGETALAFSEQLLHLAVLAVDVAFELLGLLLQKFPNRFFCFLCLWHG